MNRVTFSTLACLLVTHANAAAPDKDSKQGQRMAPYAVFITEAINNSNERCCSISDGRMGDSGHELEERRISHPDGSISYEVFVTRDIFGKDSHDPERPDTVRQCPFDDNTGESLPCHDVSTTNHDYDAAIPPEGKWFPVPPDKVLEGWQKHIQECFKEKPNCIAPTDNILWLSTGGYVYCYLPIRQWTQNISSTRFARLELK